MSRGATASTAVTLVFTCVGRRVELVQAFRAAARRLKLRLHIVGLDSDITAPALSCVDRAIVTPRASDADYLPALLKVIRTHKATALIPTTDVDLQVISQNRAAIANLGCTPLIAEPDVIETCRDKMLTFAHLRRHGMDTPQTWTAAEILARPDRQFPLFIKPRAGSASVWVHKIEDETDLQYFLRHVPDPIVQEFVAGQEHTLDVYVGLNGVPRCVVPRMRWQVRTGEVAKGVVVKDLAVMHAGRDLVKTLGPSVRGIVTLQCIVTPEHRIRFIEINPRFGGGAPLGIAAGADYPAWILQELRGQKPKIAFSGFRHGVCMLRYDWSVFVPLGKKLAPAIKPPLGQFPPFPAPKP